MPGALLIEADTSYLLLVSHLADNAYEFGLDFYDALLMSLDIHPEVHKQPHDGVYSFDPNPDSICWQKGSAIELALQRRLNDAARQLATMSPAQGHATLAKLNEQAVTIASGSVVPTAVMQQRLAHHAQKWRQYLGSTGIVKQIWNTWRKRKPWVSD